MTTQTVLIGSYTEPVGHAPHAAGPGIITLNLSGREIKGVSTTPASVCGVNPSYLAQKGSDVYAVNEVSCGTVSHLRICEDGLKLVKRYECGKDPCHVTVVDDGILAACFGDGSVWSYIEHDGGLEFGDRWTCSSLHGVHQVLAIGNGRIIVCAPVEGSLYELYRFKDGRLEERGRIGMNGYPRHGVVSGQSIFVALAKDRVVVKLDIRTLSIVARIELGDGNGVLGGIRMVEDQVLVSERGEGENRIWGIRDGYWRWCCKSGGGVPRDFGVREGVLVIAHQDGVIGIGGMGSVEKEGVEIVRKDEKAAFVSVLFIE